MTAMARKNLVLAGFMGTGKSTIGALVAQKTGSPFLDTDREVETQAGKPIRAIFEDEGEAAFRELEAAICRKAANISGTVIATGGGTLLNSESRKALAKNGVLVNMQADLESLAVRLAPDGRRPLLTNNETTQALYANREEFYLSLPHQVQVGVRAPLAIAEELIALWQQLDG
jgi:shikimate kinase